MYSFYGKSNQLNIKPTILVSIKTTKYRTSLIFYTRFYSIQKKKPCYYDLLVLDGKRKWSCKK